MTKYETFFALKRRSRQKYSANVKKKHSLNCIHFLHCECNKKRLPATIDKWANAYLTAAPGGSYPFLYLLCTDNRYLWKKYSQQSFMQRNGSRQEMQERIADWAEKELKNLTLVKLMRIWIKWSICILMTAICFK